MENKYRVLAIAEEANPTWTSVPLVGWSLATSLRKVANSHIVTQIRNREAFLQSGLKEGVDFTVIDSEKVARPLWRLSSLLRGGEGKGWTTNMAISIIGYYFFEHLLWKHFKHDITAGKFDIVHRITPLSPTTPSLIASKCKKHGVPFVLGPINGGIPWSKQFARARRQEKEWLSYIRSAYKLLPGYRSTLESSTAIITGSRYTQAQVPQKYQEKCLYLPENAIDPGKFFHQKKHHKSKCLRACFVGRLVPYKGPDMLIEAALPLLRADNMKIDIIGDGPMMPILKDFVAKKGIESQVIFRGWIDHSKLQAIICDCQVLAFPSIREFGGGVVLEAMALGLVPIVVDYAGPGELVDDQVGIKVPLGNRDEIIRSFRSVFTGIIDNQFDLERMSKNATERVHKFFTWEAKAEQILEIYKWVLGDSHQKPFFFD